MIYENRVKIGIASVGVIFLMSALLTTTDYDSVMTEEKIEELRYGVDSSEPFIDFISVKRTFDSTSELTFTASNYVDILDGEFDLVAKLEYTGETLTSNRSSIFFEFRNLETDELLNIDYGSYSYGSYAGSASGKNMLMPKVGNHYLMYLNECDEYESKLVNNCYTLDRSNVEITENTSLYISNQLKVFDLTTGFNPIDVTDIPLATLTLKDMKDNGYTFVYGYEMKATQYTKDEYYTDYESIYNEITTRYGI